MLFGKCVLVVASIPALHPAERALCHRAVHHLACSFVLPGHPCAAVSLEVVNMRVGRSERSFFVNAALMSIFHGALSCEWLLNPFSPGLGVYNFRERERCPGLCNRVNVTVQ